MSHTPRTYLALLLFVLARPVSAGEWLKVQTDDVIVYSDASRSDVMEYAAGYLAFRHIYSEMLAPPRPLAVTTVVLFGTRAEMERRMATPNKFSVDLTYSATVDGAALLALCAEGDRDYALSQTAQFDTIWQLNRSGMQLPIWVSQGAGEVFESLRVLDDRCVIGRKLNVYYDFWRSWRLLPWNRFFELTTGSDEYRGIKSPGVYHSQAWGLMHRVLLAANGAEMFRTLTDRVQSTDPMAAVEATLGIPAAALTDDIAKHLNTVPEKEIMFDTSAVRGRLAPVPAPAGEVHLQIANLLFAAGRDEQADSELRQAEAAAGASAPIFEAKARKAIRGRDKQSALAFYRRAIDAGSTNSKVYVISAEERLNECTGGNQDVAGKGGAAAELAMAEARKAIELDPDSGLAYRTLGRAMFLLPNPAKEHVDELSKGMNMGRDGQIVRWYRALLLERLGRTEESASDFRRVSDDVSVDSSIRTMAVERLAKVEFAPVAAAAQRLANQKQYTEARALVAGARAQGATALTDRYAQLAAWVDEKEELDRLRAAVAEKRWAEVRSTGNLFLERHPKSRAADAVRAMLETARTASEARK